MTKHIFTPISESRTLITLTKSKPGLLRAMFHLLHLNDHDGAMDILHRPGLIFTIGWYVGRFKLLTGIAALGAATAILAISSRGRSGNRNPEMPLRLVPLILAAFSFLLFTYRPERTTKNSQRTALTKVRTG